MGNVSTFARRARTVHAAERLGRAIAAWVAQRRADDENAGRQYVGRHRTQLEAIDSVLGGSARALEEEARAIAEASSSHDVYRRCREVDEALAWLQRLWEFYRVRFDQRVDRVDERLAPTVRAADEIVWSLYHQVLGAPAVRRAGVSHGPAPLPFVAPEYSPAVTDPTRPLPRQLSLQVEFPTWDDQLRAIVRQLAVPLLTLPEWCVNAPWWLIFIGHEVGHQVYQRLSLADTLPAAIEERVRDVTGRDQAAREWAAWCEEVVADGFALALLGPATIEALAEVELEADDLREPTAVYPAPVMRLALLSELSARFGFGASRLPREIALTSAERESEQRTLGAVADVLCKPLPRNIGRLVDLGGISPADVIADTDAWARSLKAGLQKPGNTLEAPRLISAGCFRAWQTTVGNSATSEELDASAVAMAKHALSVLGSAGPEGTRAGEQPSGKAPELARVLTARLLSLSRAGAASASSMEGRP